MIPVEMSEESDAVSRAEVLGLQKQAHRLLRDTYVIKVMI